jgi:tetrahydromethanopterin S-methyltransferase subunit G
MPSDTVSLKEFMDLRFRALEKKVDSLEKKVEALDDCISNDVKHAIKMWRYIGGLIIAIVVALVIAWLRQWLGL